MGQTLPVFVEATPLPFPRPSFSRGRPEAQLLGQFGLRQLGHASGSFRHRVWGPPRVNSMIWRMAPRSASAGRGLLGVVLTVDFRTRAIIWLVAIGRCAGIPLEDEADTFRHGAVFLLRNQPNRSAAVSIGGWTTEVAG